VLRRTQEVRSDRTAAGRVLTKGGDEEEDSNGERSRGLAAAAVRVLGRAASHSRAEQIGLGGKIFRRGENPEKLRSKKGTFDVNRKVQLRTRRDERDKRRPTF